MRVYWLSSYPKSGNTWIRFLLANMLRGPLDSTEPLQRIVPDIHDPITPLERRAWERLPVHAAKSHLVYRDGPPFAGATQGFIYLVRDPLDVLASCLNFHFLSRGAEIGDDPQAVERERREYVARFLEIGGDPRWLPVGFGTWPEHVKSWHEAARRHRGMFIRYRDAIADPLTAARLVNEFLGLGLDEERVAIAVEHSTFARMKQIEEREIAGGGGGFFARAKHRKGQRAGYRFMHKGRTGAGREMLTPEERGRALEVFGEAMALHGYDAEPLRS